MNKKLFDFPLLARKRLDLCRNDPISGIRFEPHLSYPKEKLGFSFSTNKYGLRGPSEDHAPNVVLGSSFAMGFTVDDGHNWYDKCLDSGTWINFGLPVGIHQMEALVRTYYKGTFERLLILYYKNFAALTKIYKDWNPPAVNAFDLFNWKTGFAECLALQKRYVESFKEKRRRGEILIRSFQGTRYMTPTVKEFVLENDRAYFLETNERLARIAAKFHEVVVIKVPSKQEIWPGPQSNPTLRKTNEENRLMWDLTRDHLREIGNIRFLEPDHFEIGDYNPFECHWNERGNEKFARFVRTALMEHSKNRPRRTFSGVAG